MIAMTEALTFLTAFESEPSALLRKHLFWHRMRDKGLNIATTEVQGYIIDSCLARFDEATAERLIRDWTEEKFKVKAKPTAYVSKFQPGSHYYALDQKFDSEFAAREHLQRNGYECLGLNVKYVYTRQGD